MVLRTRGLAKAFGATRALRDCSFELRAGEVHAIVGENGSGKSTLVKILAGVHRPDAGAVEFDGVSRGQLRSPRAALDAGIVTVFQEVLVVGPCSVLENVWTGTDGVFRGRRTQALKVKGARAVLGELLGAPLALSDPVEEISLSERQACCIARAIVRQPRVLILDEATSALDVETRRRLFAVVRRLTAEGVAVVFISHRMDEVEEICDRVTVMRAGETVATVARGEASVAQLVQMMTGGDAPEAASPARTRVGDVVLQARGVRLRDGGQAFDFDLRGGELVGLAGLEGHGQDAFLRLLWGAHPRGGGTLQVFDGGAKREIGAPRDAAAHGVAYVPRERRTEALFESLPIWQNFALPTAARDGVAAVLLSARKARRRFAHFVARLGIRLGSDADLVTTLSGGNQQKVLIARWLAANPRVLLLNDPTRGIDHNAKRDIYRLLGELAGEGRAVVMLSSEIHEHLALMDRVLVFREQALAAELPRAALDSRSLVASFFGQTGCHV